MLLFDVVIRYLHWPRIEIIDCCLTKAGSGPVARLPLSCQKLKYRQESGKGAGITIKMAFFMVVISFSSECKKSVTKNNILNFKIQNFEKIVAVKSLRILMKWHYIMFIIYICFPTHTQVNNLGTVSYILGSL